MSVSKWAYTPEVCDGGGCPGDCDLCNKPREMEDGMGDYIKRKDAIEELKQFFAEHDEEQDEFTRPAATIAANAIVDNIPTADVRDDATAHKVVRGGERDGSTCWFECDNCGLSVDISDVFCKHCGARFVP